MATSATRTRAAATRGRRPRFTVRGHGGHSVVSWRDLGREGGHVGHGGTGAKTPWTQNGIYVQGLAGHARESAPGLPLDRRDWLENPGQKRVHEFIAAPVVCLTCHMLEDGHNKLMEKLSR